MKTDAAAADGMRKSQIGRIYGMAARMGMVDRDAVDENGNKTDDLHCHIYSRYGKTSLKELTEPETRAVVRMLMNMEKTSGRPAAKKPRGAPEQRPGGVTPKQQGKIWSQVCRLRDLDDVGTATAGERLVGAIEKELGYTATLRDPFRWVGQAE